MVAIITQARVNSSRLPNKIFLKAAGSSFLHYHVTRLAESSLPVIIATTNDGSESPVVEFASEYKLECFKGDEDDVLKRFYEAATHYKISTVIRVTSDCPLIDGHVIAKGLAAYNNLPINTYYSNTISRSYPRGMDYEIFSYSLLKEAFEKATDQSDREHVTPYLWKNKSGNVNVVQDINSHDNSEFRITLDTKEDQELITKLIEEHNAATRSCEEIVEILRLNPELVNINKEIEQKKV